MEVSESSGSCLDRLDLAVKPLGSGIGDPMAEVGQQSVQMLLEHAGYFLHRGQAAADRPVIPTMEVRFRKTFAWTFPEGFEQFLDGPCAGGFELAWRRAASPFDSLRLFFLRKRSFRRRYL